MSQSPYPRSCARVQDLTKVLFSPHSHQRDIPLGFSNPTSHCFRNAALSALLASANFTRYLQHYHIPVEYSLIRKDPPQDLLDEADDPSETEWASAYMPFLLLQLYEDMFNNTHESAQSCIDDTMKQIWHGLCYPADSAKTENTLLYGPWSARNNDLDESEAQDGVLFLKWILKLCASQVDWRAYRSRHDSSRCSSSRIDNFRWMCEAKFVDQPYCYRCLKTVGDNVQAAPHLAGNAYFNPFIDISVPRDGVFNLVQSLFLRLGKVEEAHISCDSCLDEPLAMRRYFWHAPALLMLRLKRCFMNSHKKTEKITNKSQISEHLDLGPLMSEAEWGTEISMPYHLVAVMSHSGDTKEEDADDGHYVTYVRTPMTPTGWIEINDGQIRPVKFPDFNESSVDEMSPEQRRLRLSPYLLLYDRTFTSGPIQTPNSHKFTDSAESQFPSFSSSGYATTATTARSFSSSSHPPSKPSSLQKHSNDLSDTQVVQPAAASLKGAATSRIPTPTPSSNATPATPALPSPQATTANQIANVRPQIPRVSVGPLFEDFVRPDEDYLRVLRSRKMLGRTPVAMNNPSNFCYRNSLLSLLLGSNTFLSYLEHWHEVQNTFKLGSLWGLGSSNALNMLRAIRRARNTKLANSDLDKFWKTICWGRSQSRRVPFTTSIGAPSDGCNDWRTTLAQGSGPVSGHVDHEDVVEFLQWLLTATKAQMKYIYQLATNGSPSSIWLEYARFVSLTQVRRTERSNCTRCRYPVGRRTGKVTEDNMLRLVVEQKHGRSSTIAQLKQNVDLTELIRSQMSETRDGDFTCPRCKHNRTQCAVVSKFQHFPEILFIHLSRVDHDLVTGESWKKLQRVEIPKLLDLGDFAEPHEIGPGSKIEYQLRGFVSHSGTGTRVGHYISVVRTPTIKGPRWYMHDDKSPEEIVEQVSFSEYNDSQPAEEENEEDEEEEDFKYRFTPYLLMYERKHSADIVQPGRAAVNIGQGEEEDVKPSYWLGQPTELISANSYPDNQQLIAHVGTTRAAMNQVKPIILPDQNLDPRIEAAPDPAADKDWPAAELNMSVAIAGKDYHAAPIFISNFARRLKRRIRVRATLRCPREKGAVGREDAFVQMDLVQAHMDAVEDQRKRKGEELAPPGTWSKRWKSMDPEPGTGA